MLVRLLGAVEAERGGGRLELGPAKQRCVLAVLLIADGGVVPTEALIERVWGPRAPRTAREQVHVFVSRLRRAFRGGPLDTESELRLERLPGGYRVGAAADQVDLMGFREVVERARAQDGAERADLLGEALRLWRGVPLAGLTGLWAEQAREELERERLAVLQERLDADLAVGRFAEVRREAGALAAAHPLTESFTRQAMLAAYRAGEQAEALMAYHRLRVRLAEELGVDPGPELAELYQRILIADPGLAASASSAPLRVRTPVPHELPPCPAGFVGRKPELVELTRVLGPNGRATTAVAALSGGGGMGKTWLALRWAHDNARDYPDGSLFVDMQGFAPDRRPMRADEALHRLLRALRAEGSPIPDAFDEQVALYRTLTADRRLLVVLDNVRDADQVGPLLPAGSGCAVIVTSRDSLPGLVTACGAHPVTLQALPDADARALLAERLGERRLAEADDATSEILSACAGMPLALAVVAARAAVGRGLPLSRLAVELRGTATRIAALDLGDPRASVPAALSWTHAALPPKPARAFLLLGTVPGPDLSRAAAGALLGLTAAGAEAEAEAAEMLRSLERVSLLEQPTPDRYRMHDLVRLFAAAEAERTLGTAELDDALLRLIEHYVAVGGVAAEVMDPNRRSARSPRLSADQSADLRAALGWFDAEELSLAAAQHAALDRDLPQAVWQLAWITAPYHLWRGQHRQLTASWENAARVADRLDGQSVGATTRRMLALARVHACRYPEAIRLLDEALGLAEQNRDHREQAHAHRLLVWAWGEQRAEPAVVDHVGRALTLARSLGDELLEARILSLAGWYALQFDRHDIAADPLEQALALAWRYADLDLEAATLDSLGRLDHLSGRHAQAVVRFEEAIAVMRTTDDVTGEAMALDGLAEAQAALGHPDLARRAWQRARDLFQSREREPDVERVTAALARLEGQQ